MTKQCKAVLRELVMLSNNSEEPMGYVLNEPRISLFYNSNKFYDYSPYSNEIEGIIQQLVDDGYLELFNRHDFKLTHKGLHRRTFQWIEIKQFLLRSILVPIVVSIITTAIINLVF